MISLGEVLIGHQKYLPDQENIISIQITPEYQEFF